MILNQIIAHFIMRFVIAYIERNEKEGKEIVGAHTKVNTTHFNSTKRFFKFLFQTNCG